MKYYNNEDNKNSVGRKEAKTVDTAVSFTATKIR